MKKLCIFLNVIGFAVLAVLCWRTYIITDWNRWVNRVYIAGQPGSNEQVVLQMLGKPSHIEKPGAIGPGFLPRPKHVGMARKVYVYSRFFVGPDGCGYWVAYVFIGDSGQVVGVHIAES